MKYCDLKCEFARWPDRLEDGSRSCRTFIALYCAKVDGLVDKNAPCVVEAGKTGDELNEDPQPSC